MAEVIMSLRAFILVIQTNGTQYLSLLTDNTTVIQRLYKWKTWKYLQQVKIIAQICQGIKINLIVSHILGLNSTQADSFSCFAWSEIYIQDPIVLLKVLNLLKFSPTLNCSAKRKNKKLKRLCQISSDHNAIIVNAYTMKWCLKPVLIHLPINKVQKIINKITRNHAKTLFIIPNWCCVKYQLLLTNISKELKLGPSLQVIIPSKKFRTTIWRSYIREASLLYQWKISEQ
ncbi:MAG: hypothetical protein EZS28_019969 [Streblomastix strix]|uniref:Uncharacterized protein n=1 Tax=Streblomastix strix TaxID=222440 RepID=A0A5J4VQG9_9EUKA|nr:MAG: hypothetical protein EZS28_019969 [Streblomastix strix]